MSDRNDYSDISLGVIGLVLLAAIFLIVRTLQVDACNTRASYENLKWEYRAARGCLVYVRNEWVNIDEYIDSRPKRK